MHQLVLEPIQDLGFQFVSPHRQQVLTSAFVVGGGTAVMRPTDFGEPATTDATFEQTREKVTRSARTLGADAPILSHDAGPRITLALFDPAPEMVIDNPEVRHLLDDPFGFWIEPCLPPTRVRVFDELLAIPDQTADIKLVVEGPGAALPVAIDSRRSPAPAGRTRNGILIQGLGDRSRRATDSEFLEDAADDCSFGAIDAPFAAHRLAGSVEFPHYVITEAKAPSGLALAHAPLEATPGFLREVLQKQGVHGALE